MCVCVCIRVCLFGRSAYLPTPTRMCVCDEWANVKWGGMCAAIDNIVMAHENA